MIKHNEKEYEAKALTGQDLFTFMAMADKLDIKLEDINKYAGKADVASLTDYKAEVKKGNPEIAEKDILIAYEKFKSEQISKMMGIGMMTFVIKKAHLIKEEINEVIAKVYSMPMKEVLELTMPNYMAAVKESLGQQEVIAALKTFFQSDEVKK